MLRLEDIVVEPPEEGTVDPIGWFDSSGPLEMEIGSGKGGFLLSRAKAHPEVRLLGIEWANKYFKYAVDRMIRWGIGNVRIMRTDGRCFVVRHLASSCVDVLHVYHPDPWPKKRHHKRRLIQDDFVGAAIAALKPGGQWLIQSDHAEYFGWIRERLDAQPALKEIEWELASARPGEDWSGTNYEIKYAREGREIYRVAFVRV